MHTETSTSSRCVILYAQSTFEAREYTHKQVHLLIAYFVFVISCRGGCTRRLYILLPAISSVLDLTLEQEVAHRVYYTLLFADSCKQACIW